MLLLSQGALFAFLGTADAHDIFDLEVFTCEVGRRWLQRN